MTVGDAYLGILILTSSLLGPHDGRRILLGLLHLSPGHVVLAFLCTPSAIRPYRGSARIIGLTTEAAAFWAFSRALSL